MDQNDDKPTRWGWLRYLTSQGPSKVQEWRYAYWCIGWALSLVASDYLLIDLGLESPWNLLPPTVSYCIALIALHRYWLVLKTADELTRKIQIDGISIGFGTGLMYAIAMLTFDPLGAHQPDSEELMLVMIFAWVGGQLIGHWRYR